MRHGVWRLQLLMCVIILALECQPASSATSVTSVFGSTLESDKPTYHTRDVIRLRVTATNLTDEVLRVIYYPPWVLCWLIVKDSEGNVIEQERPQWGARGSFASFTVKPRASTVLTYSAEDRTSLGWTDIEWTEIDKWGYTLDHPGTYTIQAVLHFAPLEETPAGLRPTQVPADATSNTVQININ